MQVKANGISVNHTIDGDAGEWLVFSNSLATDLAMWDAQAREFSGAFRMLRYDQRGHGKSEAPAGHYRLRDVDRRRGRADGRAED